jgi:hypothetical protein
MLDRSEVLRVARCASAPSLRSTCPAYSPFVTQRRFATTMVGLTAIHNAAGNIPNRRIGIVIGCTRDRFAGATVTTEKPSEGDNCLMTDLSVGIAGKHFNEIGYHFGDENVSVSTPFTRDSMKSAFANERDRITQCLAKGFERRVAGVMIQQEQT